MDYFVHFEGVLRCQGKLCLNVKLFDGVLFFARTIALFNVRQRLTLSVLVLKVLAVRVNTVAEGGSEKLPNRK